MAEFIGWRLPTFVGQDDTETRAYLESVFPLLFVEQKRGWGGIHRFVPPYAHVAGVRQRALEFLLRLDVLEAMQRRMELQRRQQMLRRQWQEVVAELKTVLRTTGVLADTVPEEPLGAWPPTPELRLMLANGLATGKASSMSDEICARVLGSRIRHCRPLSPRAGRGGTPVVLRRLRSLIGPAKIREAGAEHECESLGRGPNMAQTPQNTPLDHAARVRGTV